MEIENYQKEKLTINLAWANVFAILMLIPILIVFGLPYYLLWTEQFKHESIRDLFFNLFPVIGTYRTLITILVIVFGIVIHELIHGLVWSMFTKKGFKAIKFGVFWKMLTPYCHCNEPLKVSQYVLGAIMPAIILGILPALISIAIGSLGLLILGMFFTMAAAGDFLIINLLRNESKNSLVQDHSSEAGCFIYRKHEA